MLYNFKKFVFFLSDCFELLGLCAGWGIMIVIFSDVTMYKIFHYPLRGSFELVCLLMVIATSFVLAAALLRGRHITIDVFVIRLPNRYQRIVNSLASILGLGISVVISWQSFLYARVLQNAGEVSPTANLPYFPFAYGMAISFAILSLAFFWQLLDSLRSK